MGLVKFQSIKVSGTLFVLPALSPFHESLYFTGGFVGKSHRDLTNKPWEVIWVIGLMILANELLCLICQRHLPLLEVVSRLEMIKGEFYLY